MDELEAENCSVMLQDPGSGELSGPGCPGKKGEKRSVYYSDSSYKGGRFKPGEGIAGWVLKEGQAMMVNDVKDEPARFVSVKEGLNPKVSVAHLFPHPGKRPGGRGFPTFSHSRKGAL